jgi:DNA-binding MurR/RpiR family transcriptional regulator
VDHLEPPVAEVDRVTQTLARYLYLHVQMMRPGVNLIRSTTNAWPHALLDLSEGDVIIVFDLRRYENNTLKLAGMAHERGARIVLFTDQWRSPVNALAEICFAGRNVVPSAWDSAVTTMLLLLAETLIAAAQGLNWAGRRQRMEALEEMFDRTRLFRRFT